MQYQGNIECKYEENFVLFYHLVQLIILTPPGIAKHLPGKEQDRAVSLRKRKARGGPRKEGGQLNKVREESEAVTLTTATTA